MGTIRNILRSLYTLSPEKIVRELGLAFRKIVPAESTIITREFLESEEYRQLMSRYLPYDGSHDLHEAQNLTRNFRFRHFEARRQLGIFRWRGIEENVSVLLYLIVDGSKTVIDFGGAGCPLGFYSIVVDQLKKDVFGRPVQYHSILDIDRAVDVIFSSHCLEHIPNLEGILQEFVDALSEKGFLILLLPAFSCERWRSGVHANRKYNDHYWTFGLETTEVPEGLQNYVEIDRLVKRFLSVSTAKYCGDDSIFIVAQKRSKL